MEPSDHGGCFCLSPTVRSDSVVTVAEEYTCLIPGILLSAHFTLRHSVSLSLGCIECQLPSNLLIWTAIGDSNIWILLRCKSCVGCQPCPDANSDLDEGAESMDGARSAADTGISWTLVLEVR